VPAHWSSSSSSPGGDGDRRAAGLVAGHPAAVPRRDGISASWPSTRSCRPSAARSPTSTASCWRPRSSCSRSSPRRRRARPGGNRPGPGRHPRPADRRASATGSRATRLGLAQATREPRDRASSSAISDLHGIGMLPETKRVYPVRGVADGTTIAAQLIGFVDVDGRGQYGVEGRENGLLAGAPGRVTAQEDVIGRRIADSATLLTEPVDGADLPHDRRRRPAPARADDVGRPSARIARSA
jgi:hypothetical protein